MSGHRWNKDGYLGQNRMKDPGTGKSIAVDRQLAYVPLVSTTSETRTLARPVKQGIKVTLVHETDGGDIVLTVTGGYDETGNTTFTFSDAGQFITLESILTGTTYSWRKVADHLSAQYGATTLGTSAASQALTLDSNSELNGIGVLRKTDTIIATAAVLTLNATPVTLVAAPGSGVYIEFVAAYVFLDFATTAYAADAGEDLCIKLTDASGDIVSTSIDGEEFEATADALFIMTPVPTAPNVVTHPANAALVAHLLVGEWATGDSPLKIRTIYRLVRKAALEAIA